MNAGCRYFIQWLLPMFLAVASLGLLPATAVDSTPYDVRVEPDAAVVGSLCAQRLNSVATADKGNHHEQIHADLL